MKSIFEDRELNRILRNILLTVERQLIERLRKQGHVDTGRLIESFTVDVDVKNGQLVGRITFLKYGQYVDQGVPAASVPFSGRSGFEGVSQYIQALKDWFGRKGLADGEALEAAFRTAHVHRREGIPTRASRRFSEDTGKARTGFVGRTVEEQREAISGRLRFAAREQLEINLKTSFQIFGKTKLEFPI